MRFSSHQYFILSFLSVLIGVLVVEAQTEEGEQASEYVYAVEKTLYSQILLEERKILISLPPNYGISEAQYPVIYVTDGEWHVHHLSGIMSFLAMNRKMPPAILVAIPHQDRENDLLPPSLYADDRGGHADRFLAFIEEELIPSIEQQYRTLPFRVLVGHSYGGLFATWAMLANDGGGFNAYIASDPTLQWDDQRMMRMAENLLLRRPKFSPFFYFDQSEIEEMQGNIMAETLESIEGHSLRWKYIRMQEETHGSIVHKGFYNGLEFVFESWPYQVVPPKRR